MKKLLSIIGAVGLTATGASNVVACKKPEEKQSEKPSASTGTSTGTSASTGTSS